MKKTAIAIAVLATLCLAAVWFHRSFGFQRLPKSVTRATVESILNVHGSPEQGITICGQLFRRVKGGPPYYLVVTNTTLVLFAYEPAPGSKALVVCNTNDCTFREVPVGDAIFGDQIGYWEATNGEMGDTVEVVSSNQLSLLSKGFRYVEKSILDLDQRTLRVVEVQSEHNRGNWGFWTNQLPQRQDH